MTDSQNPASPTYKPKLKSINPYTPTNYEVILSSRFPTRGFKAVFHALYLDMVIGRKPTQPVVFSVCIVF